jgi:HEAT repeat protein
LARFQTETLSGCRTASRHGRRRTPRDADVADAPVRAAAARVLGERGPHAAKHVAAIGALVKDPVPAVRVAAVTALDRIGLNAPEVSTLLDAFVDDPDLSVIAELRRVIAARDG